MPKASERLPKSVHLKMGDYKVKIGDDELTVHLTSCETMVDHLVKSKLNPYVNSKPTSSIVGIDSRRRWEKCALSSGYMVLCMQNNYCLVVRIEGQRKRDWIKKYLCLCFCFCFSVPYDKGQKLPASLKKFLEDHEKICLVGIKTPHKHCHGIADDIGVRVGDMAARVLEDPDLYSTKDLAQIANPNRWAGLTYTDEIIASSGVNSIKSGRFWKGRALSQDEIKGLVYRSYICCKIGEKLTEQRRAAN